jgi:diguanylate cyclase (GGDEF)-like protein/PAS domain S-box-containing protein
VFDSRALRALAALTAAGLVLFVLQGWLGALVPSWAEWVLIVAAHVLSVVVCARTARTSGQPAPARTFWRTATLALAVMAVALTLRLVDAATGSALEPVALIVHAGGALMMLWALLRLPVANRGRSARLALWLDFATMLAAAAIFLWHGAALQTLDADGGSAAAILTTIAMMCVGLMSVFLVVKVVLTGAEALPRGVLHMFGLACLVGGLGTATGILLGDRPGVNTALVVIPGAGFAIAVAARRQLLAPTLDTAPAGERRRRFSLLPYAAVAAVDLLLLYVILDDHSDKVAVAVFAVLLTGLVVYRQINAFRENDNLIDRLDAGLLDLRNEEQRFRLLVQNATDIVTISELDGTIRYLSPAMLRVLGRSPEDLIGTDVRLLIDPEAIPLIRAAVDEVLGDPTRPATYQARFRHADGSWRWLETILSNMLDEPSVAGMVSNSRDITETREVQERLSHEATHDALTGLANRVLFAGRIEQGVGDPRPDHRFSVVLVDLDDFKIVNDTLGHQAGDALLVAVAARMRSCVRPADLVARLGGDEFAILFDALAGDDVDPVLDRIADALLVPVEVEDHLLSVRASFGVVEGSAGDDAGDLLRRADIAMYEAKARGEGGHQRYLPGMETRRADRARLNSALQTALADDQFVLHYQPVVHLPDGALSGVEALVRWQHPERGLLGPHEFVEAAEQSGFIVPLGRWVLREACRQTAAWAAEFGPDAVRSVSVNVSARQLHEGGFAAEVAAALRTAGLPASALTVEITESTAVGGGRTRQTLDDLRALGVRVSLDDFGTGASTLSLLATCPVDEIKLDRSFVPLPGPDAIAQAVLQLADAMGVDTVAEGVETAGQQQRLIELGYRRAQGYLFARPMPAGDLTRALRASHEAISAAEPAAAPA